MKAKDYLGQIRKLKRLIRCKEEQITELRESLLFLSAITYDRDKVQTSPGDTLPDQVGRLVELENEYRRLVERYQANKDKAIALINSVDNELYCAVLTYRYIDGMRLDEIANALNYDFDYIRHVHGWALAEVQNNMTHNVTFQTGNMLSVK